MRYTAAALTAASRPVVLTIGRAADRRPWRWLSRWWIRTCRTWVAKPISTPQMLALQAARQDPIAYLLALTPVLRAVLPWRWWYRWVGDPVALILRLPPELMTRVLAALVAVPTLGVDATREDDVVEQIRRQQRAAVFGRQDQRVTGPSLASAAMTVRAAYGDSWYYNPERWPTADGYVPFALAWLEFVGVQSLEARRRLEVADGYAMANAKDPRRIRQQFEQVAYPADQVH